MSIRQLHKQTFRHLALLFFIFCACSAKGSEISNFGCGGTQNDEYDLGGNELGYAMTGDFLTGDFKTLVDAANSWKDGKCRFKNGESQINYWLTGFTKAFGLRDWKTNLAQIEKFKAAYPNSSLPALAEARFWSDYANNARGFGASSTVTEEGWRLFKERLEKSESILLNIQSAAEEWPQWYWQMIRVQSLLDRPKEIVTKTFTDGVRRYPDALPIYSEMSYYLEPRWGGSWVAVDELAQFAVENIRRENKDATYTRMYLGTASLASSPEAFFSYTKVSWHRMRNGFVLLTKAYPNSTWLENNFLLYACSAKDQNTYKEYRHAVKKHDDRLWSLNDRNLCDMAMNYNQK